MTMEFPDLNTPDSYGGFYFSKRTVAMPIPEALR
jgi:hypothetical protein